MPDTVTVNGAIENWTKSTGTLSISNPTSNVNITVRGVALINLTINYTLS